ncbi:MAG TPA: hypothetical protein ENI42_00380, partial [Thermoplasmatales archaeon]|nr:hypothetical protein [Thermoplasmatales archaeon]
MVEEVYKCECCGKTIPVSQRRDHNPTCCGKPMKRLPLDICLKPEDAEFAKSTEHEDAC